MGSSKRRSLRRILSGQRPKKTMNCPRCEGGGEVHVVENGVTRPEHIKCFDCGGSGRVRKEVV